MQHYRHRHRRRRIIGVRIVALPRFNGSISDHRQPKGRRSDDHRRNHQLYSLSIDRPPEIKTAEELKGKKVAISRFGSASDFAAREALKKLRLDPAKDTAIIQVG